MYLILGMSVTPPSWNGWTQLVGFPPWKAVGPINLLPANFEVDYVRAYKSQSSEFLYRWGNSGSGQVGSGIFS